MRENRIIKIYKDAGVDYQILPFFLNEMSLWQITFISSKELIQTDWEKETSLLVFPGGRDLPYHEALKGEGNQRIRKYVEQGGAYLGICAGAYYGCGTVEFDRGSQLEVFGSRELAFFPGIARGPAYGTGSFRYDSEFGARAALLSCNFYPKSFKSYFNGGCYFLEAERYQDVKTLSHYLEIEGNPAAIIEIAVGKGKAILSGVHIEIGNSPYSSLLNKKIYHELIPYEEQRKDFFHHLIRKLLKVNHYHLESSSPCV